jgi:hypothetical protein
MARNFSTAQQLFWIVSPNLYNYRGFSALNHDYELKLFATLLQSGTAKASRDDKVKKQTASGKTRNSLWVK